MRPTELLHLARMRCKTAAEVMELVAEARFAEAQPLEPLAYGL